MISISAGAVVLLALPVVAAGQVPGVDQVVGGVKETAQTVVPQPAAPALPAPPVQVQAPAAQKPPASAPAPAPAPAASAPAPSSTRQSAPAAPSQDSSGSGARSASKSASAAKGGGSVKAHSAAGAPAHASQDADEGGASADPAGSDTAGEALALPEDASPATLPFTGFQLALLAMAGLVAIAGGAALRRGTRFARR